MCSWTADTSIGQAGRPGGSKNNVIIIKLAFCSKILQSGDLRAYFTKVVLQIDPRFINEILKNAVLKMSTSPTL